MEAKLEIFPLDPQGQLKEIAIFVIAIPELNIRQPFYVPFDQFRLYFGVPSGVEIDLLVMAATVYLADQLIPRRYFPTNWTREISLSIPVENPQLWNKTAQLLIDALQFLTGDKWHFTFEERQTPVCRYGPRHSTARQLYAASSVCLFSGGLDSLVGAIDLLEKQSDPVLLVGHYDRGSIAKKAQTFLARKLDAVYPWRINLIQTWVGAALPRRDGLWVLNQLSSPQIREPTFRSRSIIFLALGLYAARQLGRDRNIPLFIPENGFIALNPPLTEGRIGSCSTRTAHPAFLIKFGKVIESLGIMNPIINPLSSKSKGEILSDATNAVLVNQLIPSTISCAHPTRRQGWKRRHVTHCGYCVPCLIRRASLHRVGLDNGIDYGLDVLTGDLEITDDIASDFRGVLSWVSNLYNQNQTLDGVVSHLFLPYTDQSVARHIIASGYKEMIKIISDKATDTIKSWAGLENI